MLLLPCALRPLFSTLLTCALLLWSCSRCRGRPQSLSRENRRLREYSDELSSASEQSCSAALEVELAKAHAQSIEISARYNRLQGQAKELHLRHEELKEVCRADRVQMTQTVHQLQAQMARAQEEQASDGSIAALKAELSTALEEQAAFAMQSSALAAAVEVAADKQHNLDQQANEQTHMTFLIDPP